MQVLKGRDNIGIIVWQNILKMKFAFIEPFRLNYFNRLKEKTRENEIW